MFQNQRQIDEAHGFEEEKTQHNILETIFDCELIATTRYSLVDFVNDKFKLMIEMKSLRYNQGDLQSYMLGKCKIDYFRKMYNRGYSVFVIFVLKDKTKIYYQWSEDDFDPSNFRPFKNTNRCELDSKIHYYIPSNLFSLLEDTDVLLHLDFDDVAIFC